MDTRNDTSFRIFWRSVLEGMALSPYTPLYSADDPALSPPTQPRHSDLDALRSDWERIGADFRRVITRETASA